ncbi:MAG TPA: S-layer protein, partial [Planctomycetaceae bacterium]|nr:S-layer protein [Planctomycetaceae bacterium]
DRLVDSPGYAEYFANKWSAVLRNKRRGQNDIPYTFRFHAWIRDSLAQNLPYDQFVRSVITATGDVQTHPPVAWYREVSTASEQMEDTGQLFLGTRLGCAKCHHHPFERWSQQDYYQFEAFFSQVGLKSSRFNPQANMPDMVFLKGNAPTANNPRSKEPVKAAGLGGPLLDIESYEDARHRLVDWMVAPDNPFFAKTLVNRYWKHFFGRGIVDPEDDLRVTNPPSNPELLDALAEHFRQKQFDLKDLVRTICKSNLYQLSSEPTEFNASDRQNFSSFYQRRLNAEVLYDAINSVVGLPANFGGVPQGMTAVQLPDNGFNNYFLQVFGKPASESACECERSPEANLAQSLHLLNSGDIQNRLQNGQGIAAELARDMERSDDDKANTLYRRAFARNPNDEEFQLIRNHVASATNKQQAWEDILWAIINAKEFQFVR